MRANVTLASRLGCTLGHVLIAFALFGCEALDPIHTEHLCTGQDVVSANCPQCLTPPFAIQCPQCQGDASADCTGSGMLPTSTADAGAANGGNGQPVSGSQAVGRAGQSAQPSAGKTGNAGASGSAGMSTPQPSAGAGGVSVDLPGCQSDAECSAPEPACRFVTATCVECTENKHCRGHVCDTQSFRCVECLDHPDCSSGACDILNHTCVPCTTDQQCHDRKLATCAANKCVDCDGLRGCDEAAKPACVQQQCVECDLDDHCRQDPGRTHCLRKSNTCVECVKRTGDCGDPNKPVCEIESNHCVQCLEDADCPGARCVDQKCVQCTEDSDCSEAGAARCGSDHSCTKCGANAECKHLAATPACDLSSGECVPCVDDSTCGDNACIRSTHKCSTVARGSVAACGTCEADSECGTNMKCVEMDFPRAAAVKHCLFIELSGGCASSTNLRLQPYSHVLQATSVDKVSGRYCAPPKTCEAFRDATSRPGGSNCAKNEDCGLRVADGFCAPFPDGSHGCTYICAHDEDCPRRCDKNTSVCVE